MRSLLCLCMAVLGVLPIAGATYSVIVPTGYSLIANHLNRGSNSVADVLATVPDGTVFTKWNNKTHGLDSSNTFRLLDGGWTHPEQTLPPGEGAWLENPGPPFTLNFEGTAAPPVLPVNLTNQFVLLSRQIAGIGSFEQITGRRPANGTIVYRYRTNRWDAYVFWSDTGWTPHPPAIPVGEAVFIAGEGCVSVAPRPPEVLSMSPLEGSTNGPDAQLILWLRDPDAQIIPGSVDVQLNGGMLGSPSLSVPAHGEGIFTWSPLMAVRSHRAEFAFQVAGFQEQDYDIPSRRVTNSVSFFVETRPPVLLGMLPPSGSTNSAFERLTFGWSDPDSQLDTNSIVARLDGLVLTNVHITRAGQTVLGFYFPERPHHEGAHTFELVYRDGSMPAVWTTNQVTFLVVLAPIVVLDDFPDPGSTNLNIIHKLGAIWSDPDQRLDTNSFVPRLDGAILTAGGVNRIDTVVQAVYFMDSPLTLGEHIFELTCHDLSVPPMLFSNRITFFTRSAPRIQAVRTGSLLSMSWDGSGLLQESSDLIEWGDVPAVSPHAVAFVEPRRFYRLREP